MTLEDVLNPKFMSVDSLVSALHTIAEKCDYVIPFGALFPVACYIHTNSISIKWDDESETIIMRNMHNIKEEKVTFLELCQKALTYARNDCEKDNPNCVTALEAFLASPERPKPIDPTDFQDACEDYMDDLIKSSEAIDEMAHANLMLGHSVGSLQGLLMECYEGKGGITYKEIMDALAEALLGYVRLVSASGINLTEIMLYTLNRTGYNLPGGEHQ